MTPVLSYSLARAKQVCLTSSKRMKGFSPFVERVAQKIAELGQLDLSITGMKIQSGIYLPNAVREVLFDRGARKLAFRLDTNIKNEALVKTHVKAVLRDALRDFALFGAEGLRYEEIDVSKNISDCNFYDDVKARITQENGKLKIDISVNRVFSGETIALNPALPQVLETPQVEIAREIISKLPRRKMFGLSVVRGWMAGMVIEDARLIPKFGAMVKNVLKMKEDKVSWWKKPGLFKQEVDKLFPKKERGRLHGLLRLGLWISDRRGIGSPIFYLVFKMAVKQVAKLFIAGENMQQTRKVIDKLGKDGAGYILDFVAEEVKTIEEAEANMDKYGMALRKLPTKGEKGIDRFCSIKLTGIVAFFGQETRREAIDQKLVKAEDVTDEKIKERAIKALVSLMKKAHQEGATFVVDPERAEDWEMTKEVIKVAHRRTEYKYVSNLGLAMQTYLKSSLDDIKEMNEFASECAMSSFGTGELFIRLVKGAYPDKDKDWILPDQESVNVRYIECLKEALKMGDAYRIAIASHNLRTISESRAVAVDMGLDPNSLEFEMLFGMPSSPILYALQKMGVKVRFYLPVGTFWESIGYFLRRMEENASATSCLKWFKLYRQGWSPLPRYLNKIFEPVLPETISVRV